MAKELVVSDVSTLIGLASAGAFDLLRGLFGEVVVISTVRDEVLAGGERPGISELSGAIKDGWIKVVRVQSITDATVNLDAGEASTLALVIENCDSSLVLMDETIGRFFARVCGLRVTGLVGVLLTAKGTGLVPSVGPFLERLQQSNFRLYNEFVLAILEEAKET